MLTVTISEARARLAVLVARAATGEEIVIAKHGVPRARLVAVAAGDDPRRRPTRCGSATLRTIAGDAG